MKKKDNLTDLVEDLQKRPAEQPKEGDQQVVNNDGELVTLGYKGRVRLVSSTKKKVIELSIEELTEKIIKPALEEALAKNLAEKVYTKVMEKLRDELK